MKVIKTNTVGENRTKNLKDNNLSEWIAALLNYCDRLIYRLGEAGGMIFILGSYRIYMDFIWTAYSPHIALPYLSYRAILKFAGNGVFADANTPGWGGNPEFTGKSPPAGEELTDDKANLLN